MKPARAEYERRMLRVLAYIDQHLGQPLPLERLAEVAHFSPYHFHRLFAAWMGETLGEYLRRRRLEVAALRLLTQPRSSVLAIALHVGFGSGEAFARAFRERFGTSPSGWRVAKAAERAEQIRNFDQARRKSEQASRKVDQASGDDPGHDGDTRHPNPETFVNVTVIQRPAARLVCLRHTGPYGPAVGAFWQREFEPFLRRHGLNGRAIYGISHDDPDIVEAARLRYDAAVEVDAGFLAPDGAFIAELPAGRYASMPFVGTPQTIQAAWTALMRDWLPGSGWQIGNGPTFEYYAPDAPFDEATGTFTCDIMVSVEPLVGGG
jgi:AraC family transcriptional regulator